MSNMQEITEAIAAARRAQNSRPKWTGSWYAIARAIENLEEALDKVPLEAEFETHPDATTADAPKKDVKRHKNGTACLAPDDCAKLA